MKIQKNVIAMIVIMGITVIPTLYAWFNISASWDPYVPTPAFTDICRGLLLISCVLVCCTVLLTT